jgi:nucleotide-binding universal stress UspA family protein
MQIKNILFPTDFSERAGAIVPHVRAACERFDAKLTVLHSIFVPTSLSGLPEAPGAFEFPFEEIKERAIDSMKMMASCFPRTYVEMLVKEGDPVSAIAAAVKESGIDLVMMPTRGHGRFRAALLGSVTAKVLHDVPCPVWTSVHCEQAPPKHVSWDRIICAVDTGEEAAPHLITVAAELAREGSNVQLVHAVRPYEAAAENFGGVEFTAFLKKSALETIDRLQKQCGTCFSVHVGEGRVADVLRQAAVDHQADLVITGRGILSHFAGGLRSQAYSVIRDMPCPVLSIR